MDNVIPMRTQEENLVSKIHTAIANQKKGRSGWAEATIELCSLVAEARDLYKTDVAFGKWWDEQDFGLSRNDRAALIAMGRDIDLARKVISETTRYSIRLIYLEEFRYHNIVQPEKFTDEEPVETYAEKLAEEILEAEAAGVPLPKNPAELARSKNLKSGTASRVFVAVKAVKKDRQKNPAPVVMPEPVAELPKPVDASILSKSAQEKLDIFKRQARKEIEEELEQTFAERVEARHQHWLEASWYQSFKSEVEFARKHMEIIKLRPFTRDKYKLILSVLHPDTNASQERKQEAFLLFKNNENLLVKPDAPNFSGLAIPTVADLLARRKNK